MSDQPHIAPAGHGHFATHFTEEEIREIDRDDRLAGRIVGQLLGGFFVILVAMMLGSTWWTANHLPPSSDPQSGFPGVMRP